MKSSIFQKVLDYQNALTVARLAGRAPTIVRNMYWGKYAPQRLRRENADITAIRLQTAISILNDLSLRDKFEEWKKTQPAIALPTPWSHLDGREKQETIIEAAEYAAKNAS